MKAHLKVATYYEDGMKLHRFIRWLQMPVAFVLMAAMLVLHWQEYKASPYMLPEAVLCIIGLLLIAITEFGFIYNAAYSYFSVLLYFINNVTLSAYYLVYSYLFTTAGNAAITACAASVAVTLIISVGIYIYYLHRKYLFVESKEEKRIRGASLEPAQIDFNPKFEREKMSRSELKEHMEKRFEKVEKSIEKKKEEHIEADPFEDK